MSPKFCCCLPLRLGVLVISIIQFLLCGAAAAGFWVLVWAAQEKGITDRLQRDVKDSLLNAKVAIIVAGAIYTFAAIIGLFGFLGAIFKKRGLVRTYLSLLYVTLILQIASGVYSLVMFYRFRDNEEARANCIKGSTDPTRISYCNALDKFADTPVWSVWVVSIVPMVVVAYACYVVHNYSRYLARQKADREIIATRVSAAGPVYSAVKSEEAHPLTQPTYSYPYTDTPNSFGSTTAPPPATGHAASYYYSDNNNKV